MAAVVVDSRESFRAVLDEARARTAELAALGHGRPALDEAARQLERMATATEGGKAPTPDERASSNLGPLAVHHFAGAHPDYAKLLKELDYAFRRYGALP